MYDAAQIFGSLLILAPFAGLALGRIASDAYTYLTLNAVGSSVLATTAVVSEEWGFLLLEGVWAVVSFYSLARKAASRSTTPTQ